MFFILSILIMILILKIILMFSKINICIKNIKISSDKINGRYIREDYKIVFKITLFKILKILEISITKDKLERVRIKEKIEKIKNKVKENNTKIDMETLKEIKNIDFKISDLNLIIKLGTENAAFTAIFVGILSSTIGIILRNKIVNDKDNNFEIIPLYINQNLLNLELDCIITFKMIHIIYMLYILNKKRRDDKNVRTSNRRTYAYSNE